MQIEGFSFSAVKAGIRYADRLDLALIFCDTPCTAAGVFTTNRVKAAPLVLDEQRLAKHRAAQAILVNSGCANACTGSQGMDNAREISGQLSERLGIDDEMVQLSSTGVIGEQLNCAAFRDNIQKLVGKLGPDNAADVANAIMTTDTVPKLAETRLDIGGSEVKILGMAKGAGMIMPNMATMLAFVVSDVNIEAPVLQETLGRANRTTFNRITVDGDTSTNDMVLLLANGKAGNPRIDGTDHAHLEKFHKALTGVLKDLAMQIVRDGEGVTKSVIIEVTGAASDRDADIISRTVGTSSLVKTAFFGEDANWGRIFAAMGRSGVDFSPELVDLYFGGVQLVKQGVALGPAAEKEASEILRQREFTLTIEMNSGTGTAELYTTDLSLDYVKINADYRS